MADISATPSSEMTNLITDYSGDPVTLDDNLGLRPRARAVSGLRPCARAIFGSAPPIIQLALSIAASVFVVTVNFVHYFLTAARRLVVRALCGLRGPRQDSRRLRLRSLLRFHPPAHRHPRRRCFWTNTSASPRRAASRHDLHQRRLPFCAHQLLCISTASRTAARRSRKADRWMVYNRPHRSIQHHRRRRDPAQLNFNFKSPTLPQSQARVPTMRTISCWGGCFDRVYRSPPSSVAVGCPLPPSLLPSAAGRRRRLLSDLSSGAPTVGGPGGRGRSPRPGCQGASRGCHTRGRGDSRGHYPRWSRGDSRGRRPQGQPTS